MKKMMMKNNEKPRKKHEKHREVKFNHLQCISTCSASAPAVHHHLRCITTCGSSPTAVHQHLRCITAFDASLPSMHHHLWCITFFGTSPPSVYYHLRWITTFDASPPCVSLSLSSQGRQWIERVTSFRNTYGYVSLWSTGSEYFSLWERS